MAKYIESATDLVGGTPLLKLNGYGKKAGVKDVSMKLYPGLRHDIFLEDKRTDIFADIYNWIVKKSFPIPCV